jgi:multimeric flavodoxin WrbA
MALILGITGSPRRGGNSQALLNETLAGAAEQGHRTQAVHLRSYDFSSCIGCERCRKDKICTGLKDGMNLLYPLIQEAKGLVLISPVHNYNVTALTKAFIDRLYCFYDFEEPRPGPWSSRLADRGKKAVIATAAEQNDEEGLGVIMPAMRMPLEALGYELTGELIATGVFPAGKVKENKDVMSQARELGSKLGQALT